jgi:hypothetical protein
MLTKGFEWAAKYGKPRNLAPRRYRFQPPCCRMEVAPGGNGTTCAHTWQPSWELPYGNPITGGQWDREQPDPGSYQGGQFGDTKAFKERGVAALTERAPGRARKHVLRKGQGG